MQAVADRFVDGRIHDFFVQGLNKGKLPPRMLKSPRAMGRIEITGPAKHGLVAVVLLLMLGAWFAPSLVSSFVGSSGYSYSYLRGGYVEQHKTNLTDHWITTAMGRYQSMPFVAFADDSVVIDYGVEVRDGSVSIRIRRYVWDIVPERIWGEQVRDSAAGQFNVSLPARGIYCLELSYVAFEGSVRVDWDVR